MHIKRLHSRVFLHTDGLQSHKPWLLNSTRVGPRPCLHLVTSGPRPDERLRGITASPPWLLDLALLTYLWGAKVCFISVCVFSNSVPAPAGITQTQEDYMSPRGRYICKSVDNELLLCHCCADGFFFFFFYVPVNPCHLRSSWYFT